VALALSLAFGSLANASTDGRLSMHDAKKAAHVKVKRLERKLRDTGSEDSTVPGCWRETKRRVDCLGIVTGADELVRWRCAVPMAIRKRPAASASSHRVAVEFT